MMASTIVMMLMSTMLMTLMMMVIMMDVMMAAFDSTCDVCDASRLQVPERVKKASAKKANKVQLIRQPIYKDCFGTIRPFLGVADSQ